MDLNNPLPAGTASTDPFVRVNPMGSFDDGGGFGPGPAGRPSFSTPGAARPRPTGGPILGGGARPYPGNLAPGGYRPGPLGSRDDFGFDAFDDDRPVETNKNEKRTVNGKPLLINREIK